MSPGIKRGIVMMASLTVATAALGPGAIAQDPSASAAPSTAPATSNAPSGAPDLFSSTYPQRVKKGKPGGTIIVADWQEANLFNPYYTNNATEADLATITTRTVITTTDDFKYIPDLAVSIPTVDNGGVTLGQNGDGQTVTWKLRDDAKWSDGTPITCDDFAYTLDWYIDDANTGIPAGLSGYLSDDFLARRAAAAAEDAAPIVKTPDDINMSVTCDSPTDMVWHFKNVYEGYLGQLQYVFQRAYNSQFAVADMVTGAGWTPDAVPNAPVAGPYKYELVTPGQQVDLVRNEYYVSPVTGEKPYADRVIAKWYGSADAMIAAYQGAEPEYDFAKDLSDADIAKIQGLKDVSIQPSLTYEMLRPNFDPEHCSLLLQPVRNGVCPFSQEAWRKALYYIIDRDTINARILGGNSVMAYTNTSPNAWYYLAPTEHAVQDLDKAAALLDEAGWIVDPADDARRRFWDQNGNGAKDEGEPDARIEACTTTRQYRQDMLALVSGWFNEIGVEVTISPVSSVDVFASWNESTPQTTCSTQRGNFDFALHAFEVPVDPVSNFGVYHSTQVPPNGQNEARVNIPAIDDAMEAVKNTVDYSVVKDAMNTFQQVYIDEAVETPVFYWAHVYLINPKIQNYTGNPSQIGPLWNIQDWFFKGKKKG